ncbi:STAS domain-containing protein [Streptomyces sp. t39]|uniref:STAS domain-containing protein n=1 Tax=Streptomyces sp. t39 TaxID=1828156 RepID=UPI0021CA8DC1|nr:STAS domain-containing protein [Streptomyces sp. t39]
MQNEDTAVAQLPKRLDYDNASIVGWHCQDLVGQGCATLVLDASHVEYLDSSGVSMIVALWRVLDGRAGILRVAALSDHYQQVWRILGLDSVLPLSPTVQAALSAPVAGDHAGTTGSSGVV